MDEARSLALIVAYYLSKFDQTAYKHLGLGSVTATHQKIGQALGINPNSIKNVRDEFDPLHDNPRAGWHQRPPRPSRAKVVQAFQHMSEEELRDVVDEILNNPDFRRSEDVSAVVEPIHRELARKGKAVFVIRGPTARKAEEAFITHHRDSSSPIPGTLVDKRDHGCGYDFEIQAEGQSCLVEVKGLEADSGGILLTSKEWHVAKEEGDRYFLAIIRSVTRNPSVQIIKNPASVLNPKKSVFTTVQVRWTVSGSELPPAG
jgi:hypothetical protein